MYKNVNVYGNNRSRQIDEYFFSNGSYSIYITTSGGLFLSATDSVNGVNVPDHDLIIARHNDAGSGYSLVKNNGSTRLVNARSVATLSPTQSRRNYYTQSLNAQAFASNMYANSATLAADAIALSKLKSKIRDLNGDMNAVIPLAELSEARKIHQQILKSSVDLVRAIVTKPSKLNRYQFRAMSQYWLTWSFGVKPLVGDLKDVTKSINTLLNRDISTARKVGVHSERFIPSMSKTSVTACAGFDYKATPRRWVDHRVKYTAGILMDVYGVNDYDLMTHLSLDNLGAPLIPALWELTPYSWLVDYFTTFGQFAEDFFRMRREQTYYVSKSVRQSINTHYDYIMTNSSPIYFRMAGGNHFLSSEQIFYSRSKLSALPITPFRLRTVDEIGSRAATKLGNLISVLGTRVHRGR